MNFLNLIFKKFVIPIDNNINKNKNFNNIGFSSSQSRDELKHIEKRNVVFHTLNKGHRTCKSYVQIVSSKSLNK